MEVQTDKYLPSMLRCCQKGYLAVNVWLIIYLMKFNIFSLFTLVLVFLKSRLEIWQVCLLATKHSDCATVPLSMWKWDVFSEGKQPDIQELHPRERKYVQIIDSSSKTDVHLLIHTKIIVWDLVNLVLITYDDLSICIQLIYWSVKLSLITTGSFFSWCGFDSDWRWD